MLIVMAGLPASGKSTIALQLQQALSAVLLDKDRVRASLFADRVDYSRAQNDLCLETIYSVARYLIKLDPATKVLLDGRTYSRQYQVAAVSSCAQELETPLRIIECVCSEESARTRLLQDQSTHLARDRNADMYMESRRTAEEITQEKLVLFTDEYDLEQCVTAALTYLGHTA